MKTLHVIITDLLFFAGLLTMLYGVYLYSPRAVAIVAGLIAMYAAWHVAPRQGRPPGAGRAGP